MTNTYTETIPGNNSCIIVSCYDKTAPGIGPFWDYYRTFGFTLKRIEFSEVLAGGQKAVPAWCRIPAVRETINEYPKSRVIYLDIDTKINPKVWCSLPDIKEYAPIVMNSLIRINGNGFVLPGKFSVLGTQVQANAFIVTSGQHGMKAMEKWESAYDDIRLQDQGVIHLRERGLCGIPGWIQCYRNPNQNNCHCAAIKDRGQKENCIRTLFDGSKNNCKDPM